MSKKSIITLALAMGVAFPSLVNAYCSCWTKGDSPYSQAICTAMVTGQHTEAQCLDVCKKQGGDFKISSVNATDYNACKDELTKR